MKPLLLLLLFGAAACADDPCAELAAVCELCPDEGDGRVAAESCRRTVGAADPVACEERLDQRTYEAFGCR